MSIWIPSLRINLRRPQCIIYIYSINLGISIIISIAPKELTSYKLERYLFHCDFFHDMQPAARWQRWQCGARIQPRHRHGSQNLKSVQLRGPSTLFNKPKLPPHRSTICFYIAMESCSLYFLCAHAPFASI